MADTNLSCILYGIKDLRMEELPVTEPGPGEVKINIRSVGICGSDVTYWQKGAIGEFTVTSPTVLGHEPSGVVAKVGEGVHHLRVGDRVAVEPNNPCASCQMCKVGHYNLCDNLKYLGTPPIHGCIRRVSCHPANFVYKLPDSVSFDEGALVQPLALGFYAVDRAGVRVGHYVLVSGAGPLGMAVVLAAKAYGAAKIIIVTDILQDRLDYISQIGADVTILVDLNEPPEDLSRRCVQALGGKQVDATIECSGHYLGTSNAIYSTKKRGVVVQAGFGTPTSKIPLVDLTLKELDLRGMSCFCNNYPTVIEALSSGKLNVKQLITHRFPLEQALEALETAHNRQGVKIIIDCTREQDKCLDE